MSTNTYHTTTRTRLQAAIQKAVQPPEFTYKDDSDFAAFCTAIRQEVEIHEITREGKNGPEPDSVRKNKLYGVWFTSKTFRKHWQHPTKRSENDMLWILYNRGWSFAQGGIAVVSWWRFHRRTITDQMVKEVCTRAEGVWDEVQEKEMKKKSEVQQNSLRNRIIWFLQQQPATTAFLATKLNATSKAVDSHLYRLRKEGIVERQSWGLYALAGAATEDAKPMPTATADDRPKPSTDAVTGHSTTARTLPSSLNDVDSGVAQPKGLPSLSYRETPSHATDAFEWASREMSTAEPSWSRL
jgi:hypothetical protein